MGKLDYMNKSFISILKYGLKGGVMAAILNLIIFELAFRVFDVGFNVVLGGVPSVVAEWNVIVASIIPSLVASVIYFLLVKKTSKPDKIFRILAVVFLLFSFGGPFTMASALSDKLVLGLMHIVAAFEITKSLTHDSKRSLV